MAKSRLKEIYDKQIKPNLMKKLQLKNVMEAPRLEKIVINVGVKDAINDSRAVQTAAQVIASIAGQAPVKTKARKSIASFKLREGMQIGVKVTLRRDAMYDFLDKLINLSLPKVRDFQGVTTQFDGQGNYNLGIKEWSIFPETESLATSDKISGLNVTIHTSALTNDHGYELLKSFGMPFRKAE